MEKHLIAIDLDGTLLQDWETVSDETVQYLKALQEHGHTIVLATGRPFRSTEYFYDTLGLDTPMINYNGGLVTSKNDPNFKSYSLTVDRNLIIQLFEDNKQHIHNAFGEVRDDIHLWYEDEEIAPLLHNFNGARLFVGDFKDTLKEDTNGFIIISKKGHGQHIEQYMKENFQDKVLFRNWGNEYKFIIEVFTPQTNKGSALKYVSEYLGFDRQHIIAIGDGHNDIEMLQFAKRGIAMKNAHDSLLEVADEVTEFDNKENGLIRHLESIFNIQK
jgi:Cof subfamily protein (haloacid dehalogenase superfamily)